MTARRLCELLNIRHPVIQAPMAGHQDSDLALAVTGCGGLGSLPCATLDPATLATELALLPAATDGSINVNFFCHAAPRPDPDRQTAWLERLAPYFLEWGLPVPAPGGGSGRQAFGADTLKLLEAKPPRVVSFHFGLPAPELVARVKALGARIMASATTVEEARWLERRGADVIIAQGLEAGGHRGMFLTRDLTSQSGLFALLPRMARAVSVPIVAAGGIGDAASVAAAMRLGAAGVQVGSAYLLTPEARIKPLHAQALASTEAEDTAVTHLFSGRPARGIVNRLMRELGPLSTPIPDFPLAGAALAPLQRAAEAAGCADFTSLWCGQRPPRLQPSAAALTAELAAGSREV